MGNFRNFVQNNRARLRALPVNSDNDVDLDPDDRELLEAIDSTINLLPLPVSVNIEEYDRAGFDDLFGIGVEGNVGLSSLLGRFSDVASASGLSDLLNRFPRAGAGFSVGVSDADTIIRLAGEASLGSIPSFISGQINNWLEGANSSGSSDLIINGFRFSNTDSYLGGFFNPLGRINESSIDNVKEYTLDVELPTANEGTIAGSIRFIVDRRTYRTDVNDDGRSDRATAIEQVYTQIDFDPAELEQAGFTAEFIDSFLQEEVLETNVWDYSTRRALEFSLPRDDDDDGRADGEFIRVDLDSLDRGPESSRANAVEEHRLADGTLLREDRINGTFEAIRNDGETVPRQHSIDRLAA